MSRSMVMEDAVDGVGLGLWQVPLLLSLACIQVLVPLHKSGSPFLAAPLPFYCQTPHNYASSNTSIMYDSHCLGEKKAPAQSTNNTSPQNTIPISTTPIPFTSNKTGKFYDTISFHKTPPQNTSSFLYNNSISYPYTSQRTTLVQDTNTIPGPITNTNIKPNTSSHSYSYTTHKVTNMPSHLHNVTQSSLNTTYNTNSSIEAAVYYNNIASPHTTHNLTLILLGEVQKDMSPFDTIYNSTSTGPPSCPIVYYDTSVFKATIVSQFGLICEREPLHMLFQTMFTIGGAIAILISGHITDRLGRKVSLWIWTAVCLPSALLIPFIPSYPAILALRVILGAGCSSLMILVYCLVLECCPTKLRVGVVTSSAMLYGLALTALGALSLALTDWHHLQLVCTVPAIMLTITASLVNESPRWLVQHGRHHEAVAVLSKAAQQNNKPLDLLECDVGGEKHDAGLLKETWQCMASPAMFTILFAASVLSFSNRLFWFGLILNVHNFTSTKPHQYMQLMGVSHFVSVLLALPISYMCTRRRSILTCHLLATVLQLIILLLPSGSEEARWVLVMTAYCLVAVVYEINAVYFLELMPTVIRSRGTTFLELLGVFGEFCAPFITDVLVVYGEFAVNLAFVGFGLAGGLVTLLLPETKDQPMPETIKDMEDRRKGTITQTQPLSTVYNSFSTQF